MDDWKARKRERGREGEKGVRMRRAERRLAEVQAAKQMVPPDVSDRKGPLVTASRPNIQIQTISKVLPTCLR